MAESAVKSTADFLGKILVEEGKYLWGAEGKVEELRDELLWMRSFLREADTLQYTDESVRMWVSQIKDHVSEAEDIIEDFVIKVVSCRRVNGFLNKLKRYSCILRELYDLHQAASSIDSLKVKISTLAPKMEKYGLKRSLGINTDKAQEALVEQVQQGLKYAHLEEKKIVGLERNAKEVIDALRSATPGKGFHAIYGMGGLGKTTLATKVSQDDGIKQHFIGGQAFVYISKQFNRQSVLQDVLKELNSSSSESDLDSKLREVLKNNKCLVVLDDVWTQQAWDILKPTFTACGGDSGSKVLITTRKEDVAKYIDFMALHKPDPLTEDESWALLQKMMGQDLQERSGRKDDSKKIKLGKEMLKVCNGLPLAIVALGGILRKKQSLAEWDSVHKNISSHLRMESDHGRSCMDILLQSYYDLPFHLKPCFLHLAHFPEDYRIWTENLYWMWVAEGLVTRSSCNERTSSSRKSLEEVANDYMNELALVGLVEIVEKTSEGWIESIRMHDLVRDVCLEKATTEDFLKTVDLRPSQDNQQLSTFDYYSSKRVLRLSIHLPSPEDSTVDNLAITDTLSSRGHKYLRSLLFTIPYKYADYEDQQCQQLMENICNEVQMLRVLVLENMRLKGRLTSQVGNLLHLRYLSLEGTGVSEVPLSIGKLRFLEILNLKVEKELIIPNTLWKLFRLRHLLLPSSGYEIKKQQGRNLPLLEEPKKMRVDTLISLETIENMQVEKHRTKDLLKIKNLRRLSIQGQRVLIEEEMLHIISALNSSVGSCSEIKVGGDVISKNPTILLGFVFNHELKIIGRISIHLTQNVDYFSQFLVRLVLEECELEDDPMRILGSLCHLRSLELNEKSYVGTKLSCHSNSFPLLEDIWLQDLERLEVFEAEDGSMPKLEELNIRWCTNLNGMPDVLPSSLKEIDLFGSGKTPQGGVNLEGGVQIVNPYDFEEWLKDAVLKAGEYEKVILLGERSVGREPLGMKLSHNKDVNRDFDAIAMTCVPRRRRRGDDLIPRHILKRLLRDLKPIRPDEHYEDLSRMSSEKLIAEIQQVMQQTKCLVILEGVDLHHLHCLDDFDKTFGLIAHHESFRSKLVITTSTSDNDQVSPAMVADHCNRLKIFNLRRPTPVETYQILEDLRYWRTNAGIKWNMMRHCSGHPLSALLLAALLNTKENLLEWATKHSLEKHLTGSNPYEIFSICYNDLPLHLRSCLIFLANFPEGTQIPTKRLFQMWTAAGFFISKHDGVTRTEEHLKNLASTYLTELVQRGMVTILKEGPNERAKTCRLDFALRDMCLEKAKEEHILTIVDLFKHTTSRSNSNIKTQQLAVHLDQISSSTDQQESLVDPKERNVYKILMDRLDTVEECHPMSAFSLVSIKFLVFFGLTMILAWTLTLDMMKHNRFLQLMMWKWGTMFLVIALGLSVVYFTVYKYVVLFTRHMMLYLEEKGPNEQLISSFSFISSPTSLLMFPNVSDRLYNEEKWEWLLYICKHFQMLRVLDLEGMWMTKGSLPKHVGDLSQLRYLSLKGTWVSELPPSIENLSNLETLDLRVLESIIIPDVLLKLSRLINLYLPDHFTIPQEIEKLRIHGMNCLQILVNLQTDTVWLNDLLLLKRLRKISIRKIHAVDEFNDILRQLSKSLEVSINSEIINANPTILSSFHSLHKLKIKGAISIELRPEMFPAQLEELTLKHTKLERDPLPVLENLSKLKSLYCGHESFLGKTMTVSGVFHDRTVLTLCSLSYLEKVYVPYQYKYKQVVIIDCWRVFIEMPPSTSNTIDEEEDTHLKPKCLDLCPLKKSFSCW